MVENYLRVRHVLRESTYFTSTRVCGVCGGCCLLQDIVDDIQQECSTHGTVVSIIIPRPGEADASAAVGELLHAERLLKWNVSLCPWKIQRHELLQAPDIHV